MLKDKKKDKNIAGKANIVTVYALLLHELRNIVL